MLGRRIIDIGGVESDATETIGLGLLEIETAFQAEKITDRLRAIHLTTNLLVSGYEIHCGRITGIPESRALFRLTHRDLSAVNELEGVRSADGRVIGTSIHGLFDSPRFRRNFLDEVRNSIGLAPLESADWLTPTPIAAPPSIESPTRWERASICRRSRRSRAFRSGLVNGITCAVGAKGDSLEPGVLNTRCRGHPCRPPRRRLLPIV